MAIRVLGRGPLQRVLFECPQTSPYSFQKIRSFAKTPDVPRKFLAESCSNSKFSQEISLASFLQRYGFPQSQLHDFIQKNSFLLRSSPSDIEKFVGILLSHGLSQRSLVSTLPSCPRALELGFLTKWLLGFSELGFSNVSSSLIQRILEQSERFHFGPNDLQQNVRAMKRLGFGNETVIRVLEELPLVFVKNSSDIGRRIDLLKGTGLKSDEIDRICGLFPGFLAFHTEGRLRPLFEEFWDLGFVRNEVRKVLLKNPKLLLSMEVGELSRCIDLLNSLNCRVPIKEKILSKGLLRAGIDVKLRVDCLCKHGLIHRDAFKVLYVEPRSIIYDLEDIEKKIEFLVHKLGFNIEHLVEFPEYLGVNLERQIITRYNVIEHLRSIGGLGFEVGMKHLVKLSRLKFYNLFVKPYPECEMIFEGMAKEVKPRHPTGLWKLFKPQKFSDTKEDVRNMKLFMESLG